MKLSRIFGAMALALMVGACPQMVEPAKAAGVKFRFCAGPGTGNYVKVGNLLKDKISNFDVVETDGSMDNLKRISKGECDGGMTQSDAMFVFSSENASAISGLERVGRAYAEQVHLLCRRDLGFERVTKLTNKTTIAFASSGAQTTWDAFRLADKKLYGPVGIDSKRDGQRAIAAADDGNAVQCVLYVGGLGAPIMKTQAARYGKSLVLVPSWDRDMPNVAKDSRGASVYTYGEIPAGTYPEIQPGGKLWGTKPVDTMQVDAVFVVSSAWIEANKSGYNTLLDVFSSNKTAIEQIGAPAK